MSDRVGAGARAAATLGLVGSLVSALGCASCFPAIASLGAAIGLGVLASYEGLFIRILLPVCAGLALLAAGARWAALRQWPWAALVLIGPLLVLAAVFVIRVWGERSGFLLYPGLAVMLATSIGDFVSLRRTCRVQPRIVEGARISPESGPAR